MCFDFWKKRKAKGVCIAHSISEADLPRKVELSVVTHRFGCKLGLCDVTTLVTFHFENEKRKTREECDASWRDWSQVGHCRWTSRLSSLNMDRLIKHRGKEEVRVKVKWRKPVAGQPPPAYFPMDNLLDQVWTDVANERQFVFNLWIGTGLPSPLATGSDVAAQQPAMGCRELDQQKEQEEDEGDEDQQQETRRKEQDEQQGQQEGQKEDEDQDMHGKQCGEVDDKQVCDTRDGAEEGNEKTKTEPRTSKDEDKGAEEDSTTKHEGRKTGRRKGRKKKKRKGKEADSHRLSCPPAPPPTEGEGRLPMGRLVWVRMVVAVVAVLVMLDACLPDEE